MTGSIVFARSAAVGDVMTRGQEVYRLIPDGRIEWQAEVALGQLRNAEVGTPVIVPTPIGGIGNQRTVDRLCVLDAAR